VKVSGQAVTGLPARRVNDRWIFDRIRLTLGARKRLTKK